MQEVETRARLVDLPRQGRHVLTLEPEPGIDGYAFTFG